MEVIRLDYVTTARAKGVREWAVVLKHALKNALIPTVTVLGLQAGPLRASFGIDHAEILFGRFNVLLDGHGAPLAEALEILPRLEAEGPPELPLP
jgi:ABC-type microcin C transport system permease subunit YejB